MGPHDVGSHRTVHADTEHRKVTYGVPESFDGLGADKRASTGPERRADHHRNASLGLVEILGNGDQAGLKVEGIDRRFRQEQIRSCFDQLSNLYFVTGDHL